MNFVVEFALRMYAKVRVEQRKSNAIIIMHYIFLLASSNFLTKAKYENVSNKILKLCNEPE